MSHVENSWILCLVNLGPKRGSELHQSTHKPIIIVAVKPRGRGPCFKKENCCWSLNERKICCMQIHVSWPTRITDTFALSQELRCPEGNSSSFIQPTVQYNALLVLTLRTKQYYLHIVHSLTTWDFTYSEENLKLKLWASLLHTIGIYFSIIITQSLPHILVLRLNKVTMNELNGKKERTFEQRLHQKSHSCAFHHLYGWLSEAKLSYITSPNDLIILVFDRARMLVTHIYLSLKVMTFYLDHAAFSFPDLWN